MLERRTGFNAYAGSSPASTAVQLGQRVVALVGSGVCNIGERGVVYELYDRAGYDKAGGIGASIIFERGGYDGFAPGELRLVRLLPEWCEFARRYEFRNVGQVRADYLAGRFTFAPAQRERGAGLR